MTYDIVFYAPRIGAALAASRASHPGGAETQLSMLAPGLAARGLRVAIVAFDTPEGLPAEVDGVDVVVRQPYGQGVGKLREPAVVARTLGRLDARCILQRGATIDTAFAAAAARRKRVPFVFSAASDADFHMQGILDSAWERTACRRAIRRASRIVVQTELQIELCRRFMKRDSTHIRSVAKLGPVYPSPGKDILWLARLSHYKHPEAFVELARRLPDLPFTLVGIPDPAWPEGQAVLRDAAALPNVNVIDGLPRPEALERIGRAAVVVNTSSAEGMPNVFLEAWGRGVPIVSLHSEPVREIDQHDLGYFCDSSLDVMTDRVRQLWSSRGDATLASARQAFVRARHDEDVVIDQWAELIGNLVRRS